MRFSGLLSEVAIADKPGPVLNLRHRWLKWNNRDDEYVCGDLPRCSVSLALRFHGAYEHAALLRALRRGQLPFSRRHKPNRLDEGE